MILEDVWFRSYRCQLQKTGLGNRRIQELSKTGLRKLTLEETGCRF